MAKLMSASFSYGTAGTNICTEMTTKTDITTTLAADSHARQAVDRAKALVAGAPDRAHSPGWASEAAHVGDLAVLALALRA